MHNDYDYYGCMSCRSSSYRESVRPKSDADKLAEAKHILRQHLVAKRAEKQAALDKWYTDELVEINRLIP